MNEQFFEKLRQLILNCNHTGKPVYLALAEQMEQYILSGAWPDALRLPPDAVFAEKLGTSHITLGKALNQLRKKELLQRSRSLGTFVYTPKENIRGTTVQNQKKIVALLLDDVQSATIDSLFLRKLLTGLEAENFSILLQSAAGKPLQQFRQLQDAMINPECQGALVWSIFDNDSSRRILAKKPARWPVVLMNETPDVPNHEFDSVVYDGYKAGFTVGENFFCSGGKHIIFFTADWRLHYDSIRLRLQGLHQAARQYGSGEEDIEVINYHEDQIPLEQLFAARNADTLLVFASPVDMEYTRAHMTALGQLADKLPQSIGFGTNLDYAPVFTGKMYRFDAEKMAEKAIQLLSLRLQGSQCAFQELKISGKITEIKPKE